MNKRIIVYGGVTISQHQIHEILPEALYHQPVKNGDIIKALRLKPDAIIIIDGYFGQNIAVWHKEILLALSMNIPVLGASSMGALRAAELHSYGMIGHGKIFESYKNGDLDGDDEVAVSVDKTTDDTVFTTLPLVNIRASLEQYSGDHKNLFISELKKIPFAKRHWSNIKNDSRFDAFHDLIAFTEHHYVDQKLADAISILKHAQQLIDSDLGIKITSDDINTIYLRRFYRYYINEPFDFNYAWLAACEKGLINLRSKPYYPILKTIAEHVQMSYDINPSNAQPSVFLQQALAFKEEIAGLSREHKVKLVALYYKEAVAILTDKTMNDRLIMLHAHVLYFLAWHLAKMKVSFNKATIGEVVMQFRIEKGLVCKESFQDWVVKNNLDDEAQLKQFFVMVSLIKRLGKTFDSRITTIHYDATCWIAEVDRLVTSEDVTLLAQSCSYQ